MDHSTSSCVEQSNINWVFVVIGVLVAVGILVGGILLARKFCKRKEKKLSSTIIEGEPEYIDGLQLLD